MTLTPLQALTDIAARLAGSSQLDDAMPDVLALATTAFGARSCAVWLAGEDGSLQPRWGDARPDAPGADVVPIRATSHLLGALVIDGAVPVPEGGLTPRAVADVMAPTLAHEAHTERLARELARGASEVEAQQRFVERVVDALPFGMYVVDREYRIQLWNRKRETDTMGVQRESALGRTIFDVLPRQNADVLRQEFDDAFSSGGLQQFQIESRSTGELRTYRLTKIPMSTEGDETTHVITVGEDITEWRGALERTAQAEKLAAIGQLAAGVMHEINNPLATIAACAETMTLTIAELPPTRPAPPGFGEYLRIIDHEVHRCRGITEALLNLSRVKPLQRVRVGLNGIVEQTLFLLKHHARFKRYPVRRELADGDGPHATVDPDQITQVLMALLLNAADALGDPDADVDEPRGITLRTGIVGTESYVDISDDGHGIPREDLTKIFEPFYTTKPTGSGTGLGLAIVYGIVRDHGGRVEVDSTVGVGTTFRVLLPAA